MHFCFYSYIYLLLLFIVQISMSAMWTMVGALKYATTLMVATTAHVKLDMNLKIISETAQVYVTIKFFMINFLPVNYTVRSYYNIILHLLRDSAKPYYNSNHTTFLVYVMYNAVLCYSFCIIILKEGKIPFVKQNTCMY